MNRNAQHECYCIHRSLSLPNFKNGIQKSKHFKTRRRAMSHVRQLNTNAVVKNVNRHQSDDDYNSSDSLITSNYEDSPCSNDTETEEPPGAQIYFSRYLATDTNYCSSAPDGTDVPEIIETPNSAVNDFKNNIPQSVVYLKTAKGSRYQLTFRAVDAEFSMLLLQHRKFQSDTEKAIQVFSKHYYVESRNININSNIVRRKQYRLKNEPTELEDIEIPGNQETASKNTYCGNANTLESRVYVEKNGLIFVFKTSQVTVDIARPLHEEKIPPDVEEMSKKTVYSSDRNRASILARVYKDLVRIKFELADVDCQPFAVTTSRSCQVEDRFAYCQMILTSTGCKAYCPVPITTYIYIDPMREIRRKNLLRRKAGMLPIWLPEERRRRLRANRYGLMALGYSHDLVGGDDYDKSDSDSLSGITSGDIVAKDVAMETAAKSVFTFEMNGHLVKLRSGCLTGKVQQGLSAYEEFAQSQRNTEKRETTLR